MEFITLSNGVKMPALGYGTFTMRKQSAVFWKQFKPDID